MEAMSLMSEHLKRFNGLVDGEGQSAGSKVRSKDGTSHYE